MNKITAIKNEIKRLRNESLCYGKDAEQRIMADSGKDMTLRRLSDFINSLQEEPVSEDRKEVILKKAHELAKEVDLIKDHFPKTAIIAAACDMAEWCDAHPVKEPVSEELENAAYNWVMNNYGDPMISSFVFDQRCFRAGAKWQKEQDQSTIELAEDHAMLAGMEKGYHQAEKDFEITLEDVERIYELVEDICNEKPSGTPATVIYKEVLKRFKEMKGNKNGK